MKTSRLGHRPWESPFFRYSIRLRIFSITASLTMLVVWAGAQTLEQPVSSKIERATVFRQGAEVHRSGKGAVPAGRSILQFSGLAASLNPQSIQFNATGDFTILSVTHQLNYLEAPKSGQDIEALEKQKEQFGRKLQQEQAMLQVFQEEEGLLLANKQIGGQQNGVPIEALKATAEYFRSRLREIKLEKLEIGLRAQSLQDTINRLQQQLQQLHANRKTKAVSEVLVAVDAPRSGTATFHLSYLCQQAQWAPFYDLRVENVGQPVQLDYKAKVIQQSGEDWDNIQLTLSTGSPMSQSIQPVISPWWLAPYPNIARADMMKEKSARPQAEDYELQEVVVSGYGVQPPSVTVADRATTFQFQIEAPYDIPSDGQEYVVQIGKESLPASYEYYCAPKLNSSAFLTALLTDWEQYRLLSGEANLFFEGTYLGKSQLNVNSTADTLRFSLGPDEGVVVQRTRKELFTDKQLIGGKQTKTIGWSIEVRNTKRQPISIVIEDQYPLSTTDEIEVALDSAKGATVDKNTGKLQWELQLKAGQTEKLNFQYSVKYPKKMKLGLE
ncbi:MAG: DUF4139 domain-containing protein [Phaeodactylibacter sp.]|nr:DUF4139 domain-containing protein [Phaeodactylibacter sp.]